MISYGNFYLPVQYRHMFCLNSIYYPFCFTLYLQKHHVNEHGNFFNQSNAMQLQYIVMTLLYGLII